MHPFPPPSGSTANRPEILTQAVSRSVQVHQKLIERRQRERTHARKRVPEVVVVRAQHLLATCSIRYLPEPMHLHGNIGMLRALRHPPSPRWQTVTVAAVGGYVYLHSTVYTAVATTPDGRFARLMPLDEHFMSDMAPRSWTVLAVCRADRGCSLRLRCSRSVHPSRSAGRGRPTK